MIRYIRAYVEASEWCFARENRPACLDMLARHNDIQGSVAEHTLDALLDLRHGLYPRAAVNLREVLTTIELRAELGYITQPIPPVEKHVALLLSESTWRSANEKYYGRKAPLRFLWLR